MHTHVPPSAPVSFPGSKSLGVRPLLPLPSPSLKHYVIFCTRAAFSTTNTHTHQFRPHNSTSHTTTQKPVPSLPTYIPTLPPTHTPTHPHTHLLKRSVNLLQQSWFLLLKEHPQLSSNVHVHHTKKIDGGGTHSRISGSKCLFDEVNMRLDVDT